MSVQLELVWLYTRTVSLSHTHAGSQTQTDRRQQLNSMVSTNYALETINWTRRWTLNYGSPWLFWLKV